MRTGFFSCWLSSYLHFIGFYTLKILVFPSLAEGIPLRHLGCYKDSYPRALENNLESYPDLTVNPVQRCARRSSLEGYRAFGLQILNDSRIYCFSGSEALTKYDRYGPSTDSYVNCSNGTGGNLVQDVYYIVDMNFNLSIIINQPFEATLLDEASSKYKSWKDIIKLTTYSATTELKGIWQIKDIYFRPLGNDSVVSQVSLLNINGTDTMANVNTVFQHVATNISQSSATFLKNTVADVRCFPPITSIFLSQSVKVPNTMLCSRSYSIMSSSVTLPCPISNQTLYQWIVYPLNTTTHQVRGPLKSLGSSSRPWIQPGMLSYGLYMLQLNTSVKEVRGAVSFSYGFFKIAHVNPTIGIWSNPSNLTSLKWKYNLTLELKAFLVYPRGCVRNSAGEVQKFFWYCRLSDDPVLIHKREISDLPLATQPHNASSPGCFGMGPGLLNTTTDHIFLEGAKLPSNEEIFLDSLTTVNGVEIYKSVKMYLEAKNVTNISSSQASPTLVPQPLQTTIEVTQSPPLQASSTTIEETKSWTVMPSPSATVVMSSSSAVVTPDEFPDVQLMCTFKLSSVNFSFDLTDKTSEAFRSLSTQVVAEIYSLFQRSSHPSPKNLEVEKFEPGSVITHLSGEVQSSLAGQTKEILMNTIRNGSLGKFTLDQASYSITTNVSEYSNCSSSVEILELGKTFPTATPLERIYQHTIEGKFQAMNCTNQVKNVTYRWTVAPLNIQGDVSGPVIDITSQSNQLILRNNTLDDGYYMVWLRVSIFNERNITTSDFGIIEIIEPRIVVRIAGGDLVTRQFSQPIRLDASESYDPNAGSMNHEGMNFTWFCRVSGENWPEINMSTPPIAVQSSNGSGNGCFGTGIGRLPPQEDHKVLTISGGMLAVNRSYEFLLVVNKGDKVNVASQIVKIIPDEPPMIEFICTFKLTSVRFSLRLTNRTSDEFQSLSRKVVSEMYTVFERRRVQGPTNFKVERFERGSVITHVSGQVKSSIAKQSREIFTNTIKNGTLGNFSVDPSFIIIKEEANNSCSVPSVKIPGLTKRISTVASLQRSRSYTIKGKVLDISCISNVAVYAFKWTLTLTDPQGNSAIGSEMTINNQSSRVNLPKNSLGYGVYIVRFVVSIYDGATNITTSNFGLIKIVATPLVASIVGGNLVRKGFAQPIRLDASKSYDPDVGRSKYNGMTFIWLCRVKGENWPSKNLTSLPVVSQTPGNGAGCFGTGIGRLEPQDNPMVRRVGAGVLTVNRYYQFVVLVSKGERTSTAAQVVEVVHGDPPNILLRCNTNCGTSVNPSSKLGLEVTCQGNGCRLDTTYTWNFYEQTGLESKGDPIWKRIEDLKSLLLSKMSSPGFVVRANQLEGGTTYRCTVTVNTPGFSTSYSEYSFATNSPPEGGECSISPLHGEALVTPFSLNCTGWSDTEVPLKYQFRFRKADGAFAVLYHGAESTTTCQLPAGAKSRDFYMNIEALVSDSFGASNVTSIQVKVIPQQLSSNTTVESSLEGLTVGQSSSMANLIKSGNLDGATQVANAVLDAMDSEDDKDSPGVSTTSQKKIVSSIIDQMAAVKVENVQTLTQVSSVVISATKNSQVLSLKTQSSSLDILSDLAVVLKDKSRDIDEESGEINKGGQNLLYGIGNIWKAASQDASIGEKVSQSAENVGGNQTKGSQEIKEESKVLAKKSASLVKQVSISLLSRMTAGENPAVVKTVYMSVVLSRNRPVDVGGSQISEGNSIFSLPSADVLFGSRINSLSTVDTQLVSTPHNPYSWDTTSSFVTSSVISLTCTSVSGSELDINNLTSPIVMTIPRVQNSSRDPAGENTFLKPSDGSQLQYRKIVNDVAGSSLQMRIKPQGNSASVSVFIKFGQRPTKETFDYKTSSPDFSSCSTSSPNDCTRDPYVIVIPGSVLSTRGTYIVGLLYEKRKESENRASRVRRSSCGGGGRVKRSCVEIKDPPPTPAPKNVTIVPLYDPTTDINVTINVDITSCLYWSTSLEKWTSEGCQAGNQSSPTSLQCLCNHLTSFGGDFLVAPNPIDFDVVVLGFSQLSETKNFGVIGFVAGLFLLYLMILILCRRADKKDREKVGPQINLNQEPFHQTLSYEVTIETGLWYQSGTTANIGLTIHGTDNTSDIIAIKHEDYPGRRLLGRGNVDRFVLHSPYSFGELLYVRVWHDSTGSSPSWFLREIKIQDTIANAQWSFPCNRWIDVVEDDGAIELTLTCESKKLTFNDSFKDKTSEEFVEEHLWISVVGKSPRTSFTRVQRATCCLSLLFSAMITNAMFYNLGGKSEKTFQLGPLQFSLRQLIIGIQSSLIVAPINLCIVQLFKVASKLRLKEEERDAMGYDSFPSTSSSQETLIKQKRKRSFGCSSLVTAIAYFLAFSCVVVSAVFTIFYSMQWGTDISNQWLTSMIVSFVQDLFIIQPSKIVLFAVILSMLQRKYKNKLKKERSSLSSDSTSITGTARRYRFGEDAEEFVPLTEEKRNTQKVLRTKEKGFMRVLKDIFLYIVFLVLLCIVCYGSRTRHGYLLTTALKTSFSGFDKVKDDNSFFEWLNNTLIPSLYAQKWYNNKLEENKVYINDKHSILLGIPWMKQNRVENGHCTIPKSMKSIFNTCVAIYTMSREDTTKVNLPGWGEVNYGNISSNTTILTPETCPKPWRYHTTSDLSSLPYWGMRTTYGGGGYVAHLGYQPEIARRVITDLQSSNWVGPRSSAVLVVFSVFNVNTEYASFLSFLYEKLPTGNGMASFKITSMPIYPASVLFLTFQLLFLVFVLFYFILLVVKIAKKKLSFFKDPWNWVEIFIIIFSIATVVLQLLKGIYTSEIIQIINLNPYEDMSFDYVVLATDLEDTLMAFLMFFSTIKLLKLVKLDKNILVISSSMRISIHDLAPQSVIFIVILLAYAQLGMLVFGIQSPSFSTLYNAIVAELQLFIGGNSEIWIIRQHNRVLGPFYIMTFMIFMGWIMMNIFVSILNDAQTRQKKNIGVLDQEIQLLDFIAKKFKSIFRISSFDGHNSGRVIPQVVVEESQSLSERATPVKTINNNFLQVPHTRKEPGFDISLKLQKSQKERLKTIDRSIPREFSEENVICLHERIRKINFFLESFEMDFQSEDLQTTRLFLALESSCSSRSSRNTSTISLSGLKSRKPSYNYHRKESSLFGEAASSSEYNSEDDIRLVFPRPSLHSIENHRFRPAVLGQIAIKTLSNTLSAEDKSKNNKND